jgi:outer membrane receptor protein involved in Fe transport
MIIRTAFCSAALLALTAGAFAQQSQGGSPQTGPSQGPSPAPDKKSLQVPPVTVVTPKEAKKPEQAPRRPARGGTAGRAGRSSQQPTGEQTGPAASAGAGGVPAAFRNEVNSLNAARENILPKIGVNSYTIDSATIQALPQGDNTPVDKALLQVPGIYQDSAASGNLHIRNEHANLQYRINGIQLPDGVAGFNNVLDTSLIGRMDVITGAMPAQYGLRTAGLVDIQTRSGASDPSGIVSIYGGSHGTVNSNLQYGGVSGNTEYFFTGRFLENNLGIENPTPSKDAIHDPTEQEKFFSYTSTVLPDNARWTMMTGGSNATYQIPNNPGQTPAFCTTTTCDFNSAQLNQRQSEQNYFGVLTYQKSTAFADYQFSYFSRYSNLHYMPDPNSGDLIFNGISTDITRTSFLNGIQSDAAFRIAPDHTLRAGIVASVEQTNVSDNAKVFNAGNAESGQELVPNAPVSCLKSATISPNCVTAPRNVLDREDKLGWLAGVYIQDEWRITNKFTVNAGLRFDQMWQYVDANQLSPRISAVYKPWDGTTLHAGYARYFTPPPQAVGAPENFRLFDPTVAAAAVKPTSSDPRIAGLVISPSLPERSHYFDAGFTQVLAPGLEIGADAYYKIAKDLIDDGQFGQAYVLTAFNYAKGENEGVELKLKYAKDGVLVYGNLAWARQVATQFVSNQYLQDPGDYIFALTHFIPTDHSQTLTASAGVSYPVWENTKASADMIYGSGLRNGDHNSTHLPSYTQFNLGLSHEFILPDWKPFTVRFDVVNLFDHIYELRDGSGIGVFAPQFGPRRGFFVGFSQKF